MVRHMEHLLALSSWHIEVWCLLLMCIGKGFKSHTYYNTVNVVQLIERMFYNNQLKHKCYIRIFNILNSQVVSLPLQSVIPFSYRDGHLGRLRCLFI